jgi:hypothetical protein
MGFYGLYEVQENLVTLPLLYTPEGEGLRRRIIAQVQNDAVRRFWRDEYPRLSPSVCAPIVNRLSALFLDDATFRTFSQRENKVDIARAMDERKIVIIAPPANFEAAKIVGGILTAQAKHAAFRRIGTPAAAHSFTFVIDEFHRFLSSAPVLESLVHETSKGGLALVVANQDSSQLPNDLLKACFSMPTIIVFGVNLPDARLLAPLFNGQVSPETLASQRVGEAHARVAHDIVNFLSPPPLVEDAGSAARIIAYSEATYYASATPTAPPPTRGKRIIEEF